jgi:hypothetical protein
MLPGMGSQLGLHMDQGPLRTDLGDGAWIDLWPELIADTDGAWMDEEGLIGNSDEDDLEDRIIAAMGRAQAELTR